MPRQFISLSAIILLLVPLTAVRAAAPFDLLPTFDVEIGNDGSMGPGSSSETGTGMGIRNIATRRRVSFATYDISGLRGPGQAFLNVSFSNYGHDPGTVNVYGVLESVEHLVARGINWNNAPGVQNDPVPASDSEVQLDLADLTDILLTFDAPARGTRTSTETSEALAAFLDSDTNGFVAFLFAPEGSANAMENKHLLNMFTLEKSLVYYLSAINSNAGLIEKLRNNASKLGLTQENVEFLDDIFIENSQCRGQTEIYSQVLSSLMDARASIISNNLNVRIKALTIITIGIMLPTFIVSLFSMNVPIPMGEHPFAFWIIVGITAGAVAGLAFLWRKLRW